MVGLIVIAVAGLALGLWLGMPGRYRQTSEDIEQAMARGGGRSRKIRRAFTPLAWVQREVSARSSRKEGRRGFRLERPEDR